MLTFDDVNNLVAETWDGPGAPPKLSLSGQWAALNHSFGVTVALELTRQDLSMSAEDFKERRLAPALAAMKLTLQKA